MWPPRDPGLVAGRIGFARSPAADRCSVLRDRERRTRSPASAELENCTKAKRVFAPTAPSGAAELTVKMLRAHGGCLGTRSRRRTWTAAISRGEALNSL